MSLIKSEQQEFSGKAVTDAIKKACDTLGVAQEQLDIEVVSPGSAGIFGLIRKKARIRACLKSDVASVVEEVVVAKTVVAPVTKREEVVAKEVATVATQSSDRPDEPVVEASPESVTLIEKEILKVLDLMGFPATVESTVDGGVVDCVIKTDFEEELSDQDGKILDSLQYIVRKIVVKKVEERLRINLDVNNFRDRRLEDLKVRAVELANQVKEDGKTQVITSLNPSERRAIHMVLQEDKTIRSRSVGDGLFKKILIYKPGKGNRGGGRRRNGGGRKTTDSSSKTSTEA